MTDKELTKRRASYKGRLTAFSNYVNDLEDSLNPSQVCELQLRLGKIENLYAQFDEVQLRLECLVDDVNSQLQERNEFESIYYKIFSKAQELLSRNLKKTKDDNPLENDNCSSRMRNRRLVKLPTIQLPKFCGSYEKWLEFHDTSSSLIHFNDEMDDVNKFHDLRASLEGSAAVVIQSIEFSASNYSVAWKILCERFDNKRILIQNHVTALFSLETIRKESSVTLKRIIDSVNKNLRSLESLGEPTDHWDTLLIHIITNKLDSKTFREWEEFKGGLDKEKPITLDMLLNFLRNRSDLLETIEMSQNNSNNNSSNPNNKHKSMVSVTSTSTTRPNSGFNSLKSCPKCRGEHNLIHCSQFLGLSNEQRLELLPQYKICFNCFRTGHYANHCKSSGCKVCKRKHNTLVHVAEVKAKSTIKPSTTIGDRDDSGEATEPLAKNNVSLSAQVTTNVQNKGEVLLATTLLKVYGGNNREYLGRAILDSGNCVLSLSRDFGSPGPVFIRDGAFMEPNTKQGNFSFSRSETVLVSCPGPKRKIILGNYTSSYNTMEAHCIYNTTFRVDRRIVNFKDIRCNTQPFFSTQEYPETCHVRSNVYHVGYKVRNTFHTLYETCFDKDLLHTHYAKHWLSPMSVYRQHGLKRPPFTEGNLFGKVRMNEVYKVGGQKMALDAILGKNMAENYLTKKQFLSRGHLAANGDYWTSALKRASFHYVNTAPQWMRGNGGDWAALEDGLRRRVKAMNNDLTVYTGTHGVLTLPDRNGRMQEVYLHADANNNLDVPVPMYFYKLVYDPVNKTSAVFIMINSSFYNETMIDNLTFCDNICDEDDKNPEYSWLRWRSSDGTFSFCCDYDQFVDEVDYLPQLDVKGRFY